MKFFGLLLLLVLIGTGLLAFHNWPVFIAPSELSLGFGIIHFPLGLILLGILITVTVLFLMNLIYLQSTSISELHRHSRELQSNKELIEKAEKSRFTELIARTENIELNMQNYVVQLEKTLDAYIGELEDRMERSKYLKPDDN